jgi:hypothetical protein
VSPARYELNSYIVFRKRLVSNQAVVLTWQTALEDLIALTGYESFGSYKADLLFQHRRRVCAIAWR